MAINATDALAATARGASARVDADIAPRFRPGDHVVLRNINPRGHTRLPRYLHDKPGVIDRDHGVFVFPDTHAHGQGDRAQHVYSVRFEAAALWGREGGARDAVYVDVWDDYMNPPPR